MLLAGSGAVLLVSGIGGEPIGKVLQGSFGKLKFKPQEKPEQTEGASFGGVGGGLVPASFTTGASSAPKVLAAAMTQLGTPYQWGGEKPGGEFDCSGLVQWAAGQAGITLPRTAAEQFQATRRIQAAQAGPGDLVFFSGGGEVSHVGIIAAPGVMVDAPHTGAVVRFDHFPRAIGSEWGSEKVVGYGAL